MFFSNQTKSNTSLLTAKHLIPLHFSFSHDQLGCRLSDDNFLQMFHKLLSGQVKKEEKNVL